MYNKVSKRYCFCVSVETHLCCEIVSKILIISIPILTIDIGIIYQVDNLMQWR